MAQDLFIIHHPVSTFDFSGADAADGNVLAGKKFYGSDGKIHTGSMAENSSITTTLQAGKSYVIPEGYHDGTGSVAAATLASQTSGTATASTIQSGYTAWLNGGKITGTYNNPTQRSASNKSLSYSESVTYQSGYYPNTWSVTAPAATTTGKRGSFSFSGGEKATDSNGYAYFTCSINFGFTPTYVFIQFPNLRINSSSININNMSVSNISELYHVDSTGCTAKLINVSSTGCTLRLKGWTDNAVYAASGTAYYVAV